MFLLSISPGAPPESARESQEEAISSQGASPGSGKERQETDLNYTHLVTTLASSSYPTWFFWNPSEGAGPCQRPQAGTPLPLTHPVCKNCGPSQFIFIAEGNQ